MVERRFFGVEKKIGHYYWLSFRPIISLVAHAGIGLLSFFTAPQFVVGKVVRFSRKHLESICFTFFNTFCSTYPAVAKFFVEFEKSEVGH